MSDENWDDLRFVLALARTRSFGDSARALDVNEATVRRRVKRFEDYLGHAVFELRSGDLVLTREGEAVLERAEEIDSTLDPVRRQAAGMGGEIDPAIRVTGVPAIVMHALVPALGHLPRSARAARVELIAEPSTLSVGRREADVAVRLARPSTDPDALTRKLGTLRYGVYCHRDRIHDADRLPWIGHDEGRMNIPQAHWTARTARTEGKGVPILTNDAEVSMAAVAQGTGKTLLADAIAARQPSLARVGGYGVALEREVWLLTHPTYRDRQQAIAVTTWVIETMERFLV